MTPNEARTQMKKVIQVLVETAADTQMEAEAAKLRVAVDQQQETLNGWREKQQSFEADYDQTLEKDGLARDRAAHDAVEKPTVFEVGRRLWKGARVVPGEELDHLERTGRLLKSKRLQAHEKLTDLRDELRLAALRADRDRSNRATALLSELFDDLQPLFELGRRTHHDPEPQLQPKAAILPSPGTVKLLGVELGRGMAINNANSRAQIEAIHRVVMGKTENVAERVEVA